MQTILLSYLPALVGMLVIALLVLFRQRKPTYIAFSLLLISIVAWLTPQAVSLIVSDSLALWMMRISILMSNFMAPFFLLFAILYPNAKRWVESKYVTLIFIPAVLLIVPSFLSGMIQSVERHGSDLILHTGILYDIQTLYTVGYILVSLGLFAWKYRHAFRQDKNAILMLMFAFIAPLVTGVLTNYVWINNPGAQYFLPITFLATALIIVFAMVRYKLFDVRLAVARGVGYVLLLVTLLMFYVGAIFIVTQLLFGDDMRDISIKQTVVYFIFAVFLALTYNPLKRFFDKVTDKIFYRHDYTPQEVLSKIDSIIASEIDLKHLSEDVIQVLFDTIRPEYVYLYMKPYQDKVARKTFLGNHPASPDIETLKIIDRYPHKVVMVDYMDEAHESLQRSLSAQNTSVAIRLETAHERIGYLILGPKLSGSGYSSKDEPFFRSTGNEFALALQNSLRFEEIQGFADTLQDKVESATRRLRSTNRKLRQLDVAKDEFVSMASHQLRTPLTSVKGYLSMVLEGDAGKLNSTQERLLKEAFTSSERMVHLIGDFLNVSRLQTGKFILESKAIDLAKVMKQEIDSLRTTAQAHNMKLEYRPPAYSPILYIDEGKIRQVLMNFMDNSIYYSREHTTITVKLAVEDGDVVATVHDTGIGVPKAEQAHLFTKFFRATNARKQRPDGTGVGLFLAKKVIDAHGGSIVFESTEGEGSTFGFRLPIKKLSSAPEQTD